MIRELNKEAYPILDGKALVKVNLRKNTNAVSFYDKIRQQIKFHLVNREIKDFYHKDQFASVPVVRLYDSRKVHSSSSVVNLEYNLISDVISPAQKLRIALGGAVAAGIIAVSAFSFLGKADVEKNGKGNAAPGVNFSNDEVMVSSEVRAKTPIVVTGSGNEQVLLASLSNPMNNYPFKRLAGHSNLPAASHTNISGQNQHTNIAPLPTHTDAGGGHTNTAHTNYNGHNNGVEHTNSYTDSP